MTELDTLMLIIGLFSGLVFATCFVLWLTDPRTPVHRIRWLAFNMSRFTPWAYMKGARQ